MLPQPDFLCHRRSLTQKSRTLVNINEGSLGREAYHLQFLVPCGQRSASSPVRVTESDGHGIAPARNISARGTCSLGAWLFRSMFCFPRNQENFLELAHVACYLGAQPLAEGDDLGWRWPADRGSNSSWRGVAPR